MKKHRGFLSENFKFLKVKCSIYLNRRVFVMLRFVLVFFFFFFFFFSVLFACDYLAW